MCELRLASVPPGSQALPEETCPGALRPDLPGRYQLQLAADKGATCTTSLTVGMFPGLWAEATWKDPVDLDLDLFDGDAGSLDDPLSWDPSPHQCSYQQVQPDWGSPGPDGDPVFLRESDGGGPEVVRIAAPAPGTYRVGLRSPVAEAGDASARIQIRCGGTPVATWIEPALGGGGALDAGLVTWGADGTCTAMETGTSIRLAR
jgi:hypothetical protein